MSQEKVARYKEEKANRKVTMRKEKTKHFVRKCVIGVVALALIGWIGYSAFDYIENQKPRQTAEVNYDEFNAYLNGLSE